MIRHENENGSVNVSTNVYTDIVGTAAANCFGVKGMAARSLTDGVYHLLRKESVGKGVRITFNEDNSITIDLHIIVDNNVNLNAVGASIISEVRYVVTQCTGTEVRAVNVYIDSMMIG
ncbi:Asp23/Gls24 family envelope stress response protein [bacterium]|nr:Asp23/Gls24 family envelope stress response protein [bacterium]MDY4583159.1 Asp23/Gls24 family envelope stress response protein [Candidatus Faecousia sp.]